MDCTSKLYDSFLNVAEHTAPKLAWSAQSAEQHRLWRRRCRAKLAELLGRMPKPVPLQVQWAEKVETDSFVRHKIYVQSEKRYWIPAYYFLPKNLQQPRPAIICLHGHSGILPYIREGGKKERAMSREHKTDYAPFLAENGYVTIAPIQRGWNETMHDGDPPIDFFGNDCYRMAMDAFLLGMTPIGLRVWDTSRLVDFLKTRKEVDGSQIGCGGLSGGGTTSLYLAAMDRRVKLAIIAGYFCTFRDSIFEIFHCICNCVPGIMQWCEMSDVAAMIAPRPLLIINGRSDPIFPFGATRRAYDRLGKTYRLLDFRKNLQSDFFEGGHQWSNRKTLTFLRKHLGNNSVPY